MVVTSATVLLYVPNVIGYARLALLVPLAWSHWRGQVLVASLLYLASTALDFVDGGFIQFVISPGPPPPPHEQPPLQHPRVALPLRVAHVSLLWAPSLGFPSPACFGLGCGRHRCSPAEPVQQVRGGPGCSDRQVRGQPGSPPPLLW